MMKILGLSGLILALMPAAPAFAEGYSVRDLREVSSREDCMRRASRSLEGHAKTYGGEIVVTDWIVYGWDLGPGDNDVALMCPVVNGGVTNAFLTVHGTDLEEDRAFVTDQIESRFLR